MASPSQYRRNGRLAFIPGENPKDHYKYGKGFTGSAFESFCDGWEQAKKSHEKEEQEKEEREAGNWRFRELKEKNILLSH